MHIFIILPVYCLVHASSSPSSIYFTAGFRIPLFSHRAFNTPPMSPQFRNQHDHHQNRTCPVHFPAGKSRRKTSPQRKRNFLTQQSQTIDYNANISPTATEEVSKHKEALNKDLSLSLDSGRIRLCEAPCGADIVLFRNSIKTSFHFLQTHLPLRNTHEDTPPRRRNETCFHHRSLRGFLQISLHQKQCDAPFRECSKEFLPGEPSLWGFSFRGGNRP